jgi:uncharacterized membrane protein
MAANKIPTGWMHNPSSWRSRGPVFILAVLGCAISVYLMLYQMDILSRVWEPFFGDGSRFILKESAVARYLPVPDASLGALAYLLEALLDCVGGDDRWRTRPRIVLALGAVAAALALGGLLLAISQPVFFGHFCTLCLASAVCSVLATVFAASEVLATLSHLRRR